MANAWTRDARAGVLNTPPVLGGFRSSGQLIPPFGQLFGQASTVRTAAADPRSDETNPSNHHLWKRKFSARDFRPDSTANGRQTRQMPAVDRTRPLYTIYNVGRFWNCGNRRRSGGELRGFEP